MINIMTNVAFQSSMYFVWGIVNTLQMILHQPMLELVFPQNVRFFYSILLPISSFDLIPTAYSTELIFDLSLEEDSPYSLQLEEMGYETHSFLHNIGSIFVYLMFNIMASAACVGFKLYLTRKPKNPLAQRYYTKLKRVVMFNSFILLFIEGYLEFLISSYLNIYDPILLTRSDYFQYILSFVCLFV